MRSSLASHHLTGRLASGTAAVVNMNSRAVNMNYNNTSRSLSTLAQKSLNASMSMTRRNQNQNFMKHKMDSVLTTHVNVLTTHNNNNNNNSFNTNINQQTRSVFIIAESTPNPESIMFYPQGNEVLGLGAKTKTFQSKHDKEVKSSLLANSLFKVHGVQSVMLAARHVTITKTPESEWELLQPNIELVMSQFFAAGLEVIVKGKIEYYEDANKSDDPPSSNENLTHEELEKGIIDLLEERVQPFVQQDGGDVAFERFDHDTGIVWLKMLGACAGCPKSNVTLHTQIKQLVIHYFPQVKDVAEHLDDEEIPRGHSK